MSEDTTQAEAKAPEEPTETGAPENQEIATETQENTAEEPIVTATDDIKSPTNDDENVTAEAKEGMPIETENMTEQSEEAKVLQPETEKLVEETPIANDEASKALPETEAVSLETAQQDLEATQSDVNASTDELEIKSKEQEYAAQPEKLEQKVVEQSFTEETTTERSDFAEAARSDEPPSATQSKIAAVVEESPKEATTTDVADGVPPAALETTDLFKDLPQTDGVKDATATVKFQLLPSKQIVTTAASLKQTMQELQQQLSEELMIPVANLQLSHAGKALKADDVLSDLGVAPNETIQLDVVSTDPDIVLVKPSKAKPLTSSDVITVRLVKDNGEYEDVVIEIERAAKKKPFLGGYRHKLTGVEYHHAGVQTMLKYRAPSDVEKFHRDCQTVFEKNRTSQTTNTTSTQMTKIGCYVSSKGDKIIIPGKYTTYEEYFERRYKAVIVLQSYFRRWQARNVVAELKMDRDRRLEWERQEEIRKRREKEGRIRKEFERRMNPKSKEDFDLLYAALEKWRLEELGHINEELSGPERKAALCALLEQETQLIASIGRHKIEATKENKEKSIQRFLDKAAAPKRWKSYDGRYTEMDTQYTIRAKEMRDIYNSINMKYLTQDERLDVLLTLKHTVKEHDCKLTREITELIDREADLLMRGVSENNLEGLRKRISVLFLQYCKNPLFNPEAARLLKVPQDPSTLRKDIYFCPSSSEYLPSTEFKITANSRSVGKSRKVLELDNQARARQDFSHYRIMLRSLRRTEETYEDNSKIAYLIQEKDLQYLVENIWAAQSILSAWDDLYDLVLVRWDKYEEWSPWNCILLTKDEATAHLRLEHLHEAYGQVFILKVKNKHTLARIYFSRLPGMSEQLRKKTTGSQRLPGPGEIQGKNALNAY